MENTPAALYTTEITAPATEQKSIQVTSFGMPADLIREAIKGNTDLSKLKELLEIQTQWEFNEAKKAYHRAMAEFKSNSIEIIKDKKVSFNQTSYKYATLANVIEQICPVLAKYGLSVSWQTKCDGAISVTCKITHVMGYSEETTLTADLDKSGNKNTIQAMGSTMSYLERYTVLALCGLSTTDQDDDGHGSADKNQAPPTPPQNKAASSAPTKTPEAKAPEGKTGKGSGLTIEEAAKRFAIFFGIQAGKTPLDKKEYDTCRFKFIETSLGLKYKLVSSKLLTPENFSTLGQLITKHPTTIQDFISIYIDNLLNGKKEATSVQS